MVFRHARPRIAAVPAAARRKAAAAAAVAGLVALTGCSGSAASGGDKPKAGAALKIGVIVPLTGPVGTTGEALKRGLELGVQKVNDTGGVNGKKVEFTVVDDGGDPAQSTQLARKLIQQDHVSMLFGTITGDTAEAVAKVADDAKVPFGTAILGDTETCFGYQWGFGETTRQLLAPGVPELIKKYGPKVAIVGSDYNYPHFYADVAKEYVKNAGGTVVAEEYSPLGQTDWQPVVKRIKDAKPDVLLSMTVGSDAVSFTVQAEQFGLLTPQIGYEGAPLDADYVDALGKQDAGRGHVVRWTDKLDNPDSAKFVADYRAKYNVKSAIPEVAGNAYYGVQFFLAAAAKANGGDPAEINKQIAALHYDSPLGKDTHFAPANHLLQADMLEATITPDGAYPITRNFGPIADTAGKKGCS